MFKTFATNVVVSKGYEGAAALRYSENGESVRFRIGQKVYDSREEGNYRWLNISVKAFGAVCERIRKMKLKEGSFVNLAARLDEKNGLTRKRRKREASMYLSWRISSMPMSGNPVRIRMPIRTSPRGRIRRAASTSRQHPQEQPRLTRDRHLQPARQRHSQQIQWKPMGLWDMRLLAATTCSRSDRTQQSNTGVENPHISYVSVVLCAGFLRLGRWQ